MKGPRGDDRKRAGDCMHSKLSKDVDILLNPLMEENNIRCVLPSGVAILGRED
jgi:hypothetical protein